MMFTVADVLLFSTVASHENVPVHGENGVQPACCACFERAMLMMCPGLMDTLLLECRPAVVALRLQVSIIRRPNDVALNVHFRFAFNPNIVRKPEFGRHLFSFNTISPSFLRYARVRVALTYGQLWRTIAITASLVSEQVHTCFALFSA